LNPAEQKLLDKIAQLEEDARDSEIIFGRQWQQSIERIHGIINTDKFALNQVTRLAGDVDVMERVLCDLLEECRYSINSGLPFQESWTQFQRATKFINTPRDQRP